MPSSRARRRAYVTHEGLNDHVGGAASVTAWVLQALSRDYDVVLATPDPVVDFAALDALYGTSLRRAGIGLRPLAVPRWLGRVPAGRAKSLRLAAAFRYAGLPGDEDAVIFNTANEMSFAGACANYVHCPIRHPDMVRELSSGAERWLRLADNAVFKAVSRFDEQRFRRSVCIANSKWTAAALHRTYEVAARVIYPPVVAPPRAPAPMAARCPGFVCVGRLAPEKRTHEAVEVVGELRRRGHDVHLHVVGGGSGAYARRIEALAAGSPHIRLHRGISRADLAGLLDRHRFGLHMMAGEHFGMAVAEMTAAGMLVLARASPGPAEVLGARSPLLFSGAEGAVRAAERLLRDRGLRDEVTAAVAARGIAGTFTPQAFMRSIRHAAAGAAR